MGCRMRFTGWSSFSVLFFTDWCFALVYKCCEFMNIRLCNFEEGVKSSTADGRLAWFLPVIAMQMARKGN